MKRFQRMAFIKCGWAEKYHGDEVRGRHSFIQTRDAHEKFNFVRDPESGEFQVYVPPVGGGKVAPSPMPRDEWLLVFVAAEKGNGRLKIVGWYDHARFLGNYFAREDYPTADGGIPYYYCITATKAVCVPPDERNDAAIVPGKHLGSTSVAYINGNGRSIRRHKWRQALHDIAKAFIEGYEQRHIRGC